MKKWIEMYHRLRFRFIPQTFELENSQSIILPVSIIYSGFLALLIIPIFPVLGFIKNNFILFVLEWLKIFKLEEIFTFKLPSQRIVASLYDFLAFIFSFWMVLIILNMILEHLLSVIIVYPEKILVHISNIFKKSTCQIQRSHVSFIEYKQNFLQRCLFVGDLVIYTKDKEVKIPAVPVKEAKAINQEFGL